MPSQPSKPAQVADRRPFRSTSRSRPSHPRDQRRQSSWPGDAECRNRVTRIRRGKTRSKRSSLNGAVPITSRSCHLNSFAMTVSTSSALTKGKSEVPRLEAPRPNCLHHYDRRDVDGLPRRGRAPGVAPPTRHNVCGPPRNQPPGRRASRCQGRDAARTVTPLSSGSARHGIPAGNRGSPRTPRTVVRHAARVVQPVALLAVMSKSSVPTDSAGTKMVRGTVHGRRYRRRPDR